MAPSTNYEARLRGSLQPISWLKTSATQAFFVCVLLFCIFSVSYSIKRYRQSPKKRSSFHKSPAVDAGKFSKTKTMLENQRENHHGLDNTSMFWGPLPSTGLGDQPFRPIHSGIIAARIAEEERKRAISSSIPDDDLSSHDQEQQSRPHDTDSHASPSAFNFDTEDEEVHTAPLSRLVKDKDRIDYIPDSSHQPLGYWRRRTVEFHSIPKQ